MRMSENRRPIGIIGGTALKKLEGMQVTRKGDDRGAWVVEGTLNDTPVVMIHRHGRGHNIPPHQVNYVANMAALRRRGCQHVLAFSAMGGMAMGYTPGNLVFVNEIADRTSGRKHTIFEDGIAAHVARPMAVCPHIHQVLGSTAREWHLEHQTTGRLVVINGPRFSSRWESEIYRREGHEVIGMTSEPEAGLAREFGLCYALIGQVTDPDNPPGNNPGVNQGEVTDGMSVVSEHGLTLLEKLVSHPYFTQEPSCDCQRSLNGTILTPHRVISGTGIDHRLRRLFGVDSLPREWFADNS
jgi:5'-methylthioadenosine phosphorylase